ncbi:hypothetical protein RCO48_15505 [Peribacillus frigoritolerans]|nr:hypothetical protein [Peribacillus frigoritolerans]
MFETPAGKSASRGDPAGESRGGSPTARGKRVPDVPINVQIVQAIKNRQTRFSSSLSTNLSQQFFVGSFFVKIKK